jgi:hypothetical protein
MVRKSDMVRNLVKNGQYQKALAIAKKFTMGISTKDHRAMVLAHECYTNARFYQELGVNADEAIAEGEAVVKRLYG